MARVDAKQQMGVGQAEVAIDDGDPQPALVQANGVVRNDFPVPPLPLANATVTASLRRGCSGGPRRSKRRKNPRPGRSTSSSDSTSPHCCLAASMTNPTPMTPHRWHCQTNGSEGDARLRAIVGHRTADDWTSHRGRITEGRILFGR